uniref:Beta-defensin n=1 Tax=Canis lupus familiaris TaxID=9615 RepID=A0A8C0MY67_CANLF
MRDKGHLAPRRARRQPPERPGRPCLPLQSSRAPPPAAMRPAGLLLALLFFLSRVLAARGRFKEICAHPNGSCQEFCLETEIQAGRCLNGHACCRPMVFESIIEPTTPKE